MAFRVPVNEDVVLRWSERQMPLRIHLPRPPAGLVEDPEAIFAAVRAAVLDWTDVAGPGLPGFTFVERAGDADIPIVWAAQPDGDWYVAFCAYHVHPFARRFGVSHILVTGRWRDGRAADPGQVHEAMLHEMGHALGLAGHSLDPGDVMFGGDLGRRTGSGLSQRDRNTLRLLHARPIGSRILGARHEDPE